MHDEHVYLRAFEPPLRDFNAPFVLVELFPVLIVEFSGVVLFERRLPEEVVLDQVCGEQRRPTGVQRLEDDLCVVVRFEVNNDDTE